MTDSTPVNWRALCAELLAGADEYTGMNPYMRLDNAMKAARAALAQPEPQGPSDKELLELMPETMRDEFSYAANVCSDAMGGRVKPGIFRVALNTAALEYAHAVLTRWGRPAIKPVPVSERLPGPEDCDAEGRCWLLTVEDDYPQWRLHSIQGAQPGGAMIWVPVDNDNGAMVDCFYTSHWLPHHALPVPQQEAGQ
jgi:hypothetical protein